VVMLIVASVAINLTEMTVNDINAEFRSKAAAQLERAYARPS
jgi:hypothetical protein